MGKYLLGIDNGGTATKAAIFDTYGAELAVASAPTPVLMPQEGWAERNMDALWETTAQVIRQAIRKAGIDSKDIAGIGCTGHGKGLYLWGKDGKPAFNAIASTDRRAVNIVRRWNEDGTTEKAAGKTCQKVLPCHPVALLAWMKEEHPKVYSNIRWIFEAKDFIRFMLTGKAYAEMTDYSGTCLMNLYTKAFDKEILSLFGIGEMWDALPPLRLSYDQCGRVSEAAADATGLSAGTPVCGGMFDIDACAISMNLTDEDKLCAITGTWSINEYIRKSPVSPDGTTLNSLFCMPEYYLIEESSPTSAGNLEWIAETLLAKETEDARKRGISVYKLMDEMVEKISPSESNILFLPFLYGSNVDGIENAAFLGLNSSHQTAHLVRAVFEGVVFSHAMHIERLLKHRPKPSAIRLSGGAAKSPVWAQMFADVLQIAVELVDVKELGTLGCCMAAAVSAGIYPDYKTAARFMCGKINSVLPDSSLAEVYAKKYNLYKDMCKKVSGKADMV